MKQIGLALTAALLVSTLALANTSPKQQVVQAKESSIKIELRPAQPKVSAPGSTSPAPAPKAQPSLLPKNPDIPTLVKLLDDDNYYVREQSTRALALKSHDILRPLISKLPRDGEWVKQWDKFLKTSSKELDVKLIAPMAKTLKTLNSPEADHRVQKIIHQFSQERFVMLGQWLAKGEPPVEARLAKDDKRPVHVVTTAKEFVKALGNDRIIHIKAKRFDLCSKEISPTKFFSNGPVVKKLKNVRIECINQTPLEVSVSKITQGLLVLDCKNIQLVNVAIVRPIPAVDGTPTMAPAIQVAGSEHVVLDRCILRDSGQGFHVFQSKSILFSRCEMYNNLYQIGLIESTDRVRLFATSIFNNGTKSPHANFFYGIRVSGAGALQLDQSMACGNNMRTLFYLPRKDFNVEVNRSLLSYQTLTNRPGSVKNSNSLLRSEDKSNQKRGSGARR
ncbi:MAG: right-handed parallel beta-helix repeat-containing protein [Phycisphaerales bacterium]|jgi:hypothetical protein|nr:right-handed parallel beta-helix repeat-containing protein [Phycisphaerales bacterium]MBT7170781.1 right-handed parallel beta-helix repeat-containing protein [Phycisphaerales bacterium]